MPVTARVGDLQARYSGTIDSTQTGYVQTLLNDAFDVITDQLPSLTDRLALDNDLSLTRRVIRVQCQMAVRVLSNPNGYLSETIDDYTYRRDSTVSTGRLYIAEDELDSLKATRTIRTAFSINPT